MNMGTYRRGGVFNGGVFGENEGGGIIAALTSGGDEPVDGGNYNVIDGGGVDVAQGGAAAAAAAAAQQIADRAMANQTQGGGGTIVNPTFTSGGGEGGTGVSKASMFGDAFPWLLGGAVLLAIGAVAVKAQKKPGYKANRRRRCR